MKLNVAEVSTNARALPHYVLQKISMRGGGSVLLGVWLMLKERALQGG
jgi:hypothetical protein